MGVTLEIVQNKFSLMVRELSNEPDLLSQFAVWLDLRLAEYKLKGNMSLACLNKDPLLPIWLNGFKNQIYKTRLAKPRRNKSNSQCLLLPQTPPVSKVPVCLNSQHLPLVQTPPASNFPMCLNSQHLPLVQTPPASNFPMCLNSQNLPLVQTSSASNFPMCLNSQHLPLVQTPSISNLPICSNFQDLSLPQTSSTSDIPVMQNSQNVSFSDANVDIKPEPSPLFPLSLYLNANSLHSELGKRKSNDCLNEDKPQPKQRRLSQPTQPSANQTSEKHLPQPPQILANQNSQILVPQTTQISANQTSQILVPQATQILANQNSQILVPQTTQILANQNSQILVPQATQMLPNQTSGVSQLDHEESQKSISKGDYFPRIVSTTSLAADYTEGLETPESTKRDTDDGQQEKQLATDTGQVQEIVKVKQEPGVINSANVNSCHGDEAPKHVTESKFHSNISDAHNEPVHSPELTGVTSSQDQENLQKSTSRGDNPDLVSSDIHTAPHTEVQNDINPLPSSQQTTHEIQQGIRANIDQEKNVFPVRPEPQIIVPLSLLTNPHFMGLHGLNIPTQCYNQQQPRKNKKQAVKQKQKYQSKKCVKSTNQSSKVPKTQVSSQKSVERGDNPAEVLAVPPPSLPTVTDSNVEAAVTDPWNLSEKTDDELSDFDSEFPLGGEPDSDAETETRSINYGNYTLELKKKAMTLLESTSVLKVSRSLGIPRSTISTWKRQFESGKVGTVKRSRGVTYDKHVDFEIRDWVLAQRENHVGISRQALSEYARQKINKPGFMAKEGWLRHFLSRHNLTLKSKRKTQQQNSKEMQKKIDKFNQQLSTVWRNSTFDQVINMDEIFVTFPHKTPKIIDGKCKRIKNIDDDPNGIEVKPLTIVLAIDTKGQMLPPLVIFKGESLPSDLESIHKGVHFRLQENGYMTEELMADWLDTVLLPHTEKKSTLLIMDSYEAHTSPVITKKVYEMNVTSVIIPGGCIQRLQPLDASINSPFRYHVRKYWEEYKKANPDLVKGKSQDVSREVMLDCVLRAWNYMNNKKRSIVKSFRVTGISNVIAKAKDLPEISETVEETAEETMDEAAAETMEETTAVFEMSMDESWMSDSSEEEDFLGFTASDLDN